MIADSTPHPESLPELLAAVARRASDAHLWTMAVVGLGGALALGAIMGRAGWTVPAAALAIGAYGAWGIADRNLNARVSQPGGSIRVEWIVRTARAVAALVALLASVSALAVIFIPLLGYWNS